MARLRVNFTFSFFTLKWILRSQWSRGLRRGSATANFLGFRVRIPPGHGCLYFVSIVCCQAAVFASGWSLVQRSPTECDREAEIMTSPWHTRGYCATRKKNYDLRCSEAGSVRRNKGPCSASRPALKGQDRDLLRNDAGLFVKFRETCSATFWIKLAVAVLGLPDTLYTSVSQLSWDRDPVNSSFIRRGPGPNKLSRKYLSIFLSSYIKLT